ncbi:hypothetical protein CBL_01336 [Carabus blaptoides fortunei]
MKTPACILLVTLLYSMHLRHYNNSRKDRRQSQPNTVQHRPRCFTRHEKAWKVTAKLAEDDGSRILLTPLLTVTPDMGYHLLVHYPLLVIVMINVWFQHACEYL